jgi:hypothetical protein
MHKCFVISMIIVGLMLNPLAYIMDSSVSGEEKSSETMSETNSSAIESTNHSNDTIPKLNKHVIDVYNMTFSERFNRSNNSKKHEILIDNFEISPSDSTVTTNSTKSLDPLGTLSSDPYMTNNYYPTTTQGVPGDNIIPFYLKVQYLSDYGTHQTKNIPYALFDLYYAGDCSGTAFYSYLLDNTGYASYTLNGNQKTICVKVSMKDARLNNAPAGYITNMNGDRYYTKVTYYTVYDQYNNFLTIKIMDLTDSNTPGPSNAGAAPIYCRIVEAKDFFNTYAQGFTYIQVKWPDPNSISSHYDYVDNYIQLSYLIAQDYYISESGVSWGDDTLDDVTHEFGHHLQYVFYWPTEIFVAEDGGHYFVKEMTTCVQSNFECAFAEGFAEMYPHWVYNRDTIGITMGNEGYHLENPSLLGAGSIGWRLRYPSDLRGLKGELIEANIAMILWDIVDTPSSIDKETPGQDDDSITSSGGQMLANVLWNYNPKTILELWDAWQRYYNWDSSNIYVSNLAKIYLDDNVARFSHQGPTGETSLDSNGLTSMTFELLSMNTKPMKESTLHPMLARFEIHNKAGARINFHDGIGIYGACVHNSINCDFGYKQPLEPAIPQNFLENNQIFEFVGTVFLSVGDTNWDFWPCYQLSNDHFCDSQTNKLSLTPSTYIFSDYFESTWLWTSWDANSGCGNDYWGISTNRPDHGTHSAWNSANGAKTCGEGGSTTYDNYMAAYMKITSTHDLRYIYWKIHFNIWYDQETCCDYSEFWIGTSGYHYTGSHTSWQALTYDTPSFGNQQVTNVNVQFYFYSDNSVVMSGVYIDDFQITYEA